MPAKLQSPTCAECARRLGYVGAKDWFTLHEGECANCGEVRVVSSSRDWKAKLPFTGYRRP